MKIAWTLVLVGVCALGVYSGLHPLGLLSGIGLYPVPNGTPWEYQMWSGIVPALMTVTLLGGVVNLVRKHNCHVHNCWRIGRYAIAGGAYFVCRTHHPDERVREGRVTFEHVKEAHKYEEVPSDLPQA